MTTVGVHGEEHANRDSEKEQTEVVLSDGPELLTLITEMRDGLDDIRSKIQPLVDMVKEGQYGTGNGISYLEVKHLMLLSYCECIVFYLLLKAEAISVRDHPVISRLVEIKLFLEKIRPIDKKLQYQMEKLLKAGQRQAPEIMGKDGEKEDALMYRPNPNLLVSKLDQMAEDDGGVYRPPMIAPTAMEGEERSRDRRSKVRAEKEIQRRASRSAFIKELANEVEGRPEEVREVVGATESKAMQRDRARLEARAQEEEELFARVPLSRVDRKKVKQLKQARNGLIGMLDDFEDDVGDLVGMDNAQPEKVKGSFIKDFPKQRAHSQMAKAGQFSKKSRILSDDRNHAEEQNSKQKKHKRKRLQD